MTGVNDIYDALQTNGLDASKELQGAADARVDDLTNGSDDEEFLSWKAGRREWLIIIDLVSVALVVVRSSRVLIIRFSSIP